MIYYSVACSEAEVPTELLTVAATEAIVPHAVVPVGRFVPVQVKGIDTSNWPPNACDAVLSNQAAELDVRSIETCALVPKLKPVAAVN